MSTGRFFLVKKAELDVLLKKTFQFNKFSWLFKLPPGSILKFMNKKHKDVLTPLHSIDVFHSMLLYLKTRHDAGFVVIKTKEEIHETIVSISADQRDHIYSVLHSDDFSFKDLSDFVTTFNFQIENYSSEQVEQSFDYLKNALELFTSEFDYLLTISSNYTNPYIILK